MFNITQSPQNPILHPVKRHNWEEVAACNGCPIRVGNKIKMVYRAIGNPDRMIAPELHRSIIGIAEKSSFTGRFGKRRPFIAPQYDWEKFGCEDPRVTKIDGEYLITYTALSSSELNKDTIKVAVARSKNMKSVYEKHLVTPFNAKAMAIFPERINGKICLIVSVDTDNPPAKFAVRMIDTIEELWDEEKWWAWYAEVNKYALPLPRKDSDLVEVGAPPIKTKDGWLVLYSHIQHYFDDAQNLFGVEAVLLDSNDPTKIIGKTEFPLFVPDQAYSRYGLVAVVAFPTGALVSAGKLTIYYGAADTTTCTATLSLAKLLKELQPDTKTQLFTRASDTPILSPVQEHAWESRDVFNPAAVQLGGRTHILYRAMSDDNTSTIGYAMSKNGVDIDYRHPEPIYVPREDFEQKKGDPHGNSGCEDPRVTRFGNELFMIYTAYNGVDAPHIAITSIAINDFLAKRFDAWKKPVSITPKGVDDKDGALFPKKFSQGYLLVHRISHHICGDYVNDLEFTPQEVDQCFEILEPRRGMWDSVKVGISSTPHYTPYGWLMLYHGVSDDSVYRVGAVLLDKKDPTNVIGRSTFPIFEPERPFEKEGEVPNVVFPCGSVVRRGTLYMYYGGADRYIGVATAKMKDILSGLR